MLRTLRNYIFWAYERGSLQYDVMVTLILLFLFITPHLWNYHDRPVYNLPSQVMVDNDGSGELVYQVQAVDVEKETARTGGDVPSALRHTIEPIAGDVRIEHFVAVLGPDNRPVAYKVWAHR